MTWSLFGPVKTWGVGFDLMQNLARSIDDVSVRALGGSFVETSPMDFLKCQTSTATPAEPGGLPLTLGDPLTSQ